MLQSIAIALGTIPMPKSNIYPFAGPSLGSDATCTAQGFIIVYFFLASLLCNIWLSWYYVSIIVFKIKPRTIAIYIEPCYLLVTLALSTAIGTIILKNDFYHVYPFLPFCFPTTYPFHCNYYFGEECIYLNKHYFHTSQGHYKFGLGLLALYYITFFAIVVAMLIIVIHTFRFERRNSKREANIHNNPSISSVSTRSRSHDGTTSLDDNTSDNQQHRGLSRDNLKYTRIVSFQAMLYIVAFFFTYTPTIVIFHIHKIQSGFHLYWRLTVSNFQGFFNLVIFLYHKVHNIRRSNSDSTVSEALKQVFASRQQGQDFFLDNLTMVQLEIDEIRAREELEEEEEREVGLDHDEEESYVSYRADTAELEKFDGISFTSPGRISSSNTHDKTTSSESNDKDNEDKDNAKNDSPSYANVSSTGIMSWLSKKGKDDDVVNGEEKEESMPNESNHTHSIAVTPISSRSYLRRKPTFDKRNRAPMNEMTSNQERKEIMTPQRSNLKAVRRKSSLSITKEQADEERSCKENDVMSFDTPSHNVSVNTPSSANVSSTGILSWFSRKGSDDDTATSAQVRTEENIPIESNHTHSTTLTPVSSPSKLRRKPTFDKGKAVQRNRITSNQDKEENIPNHTHTHLTSRTSVTSPPQLRRKATFDKGNRVSRTSNQEIENISTESHKHSTILKSVATPPQLRRKANFDKGRRAQRDGMTSNQEKEESINPQRPDLKDPNSSLLPPSIAAPLRKNSLSKSKEDDDDEVESYKENDVMSLDTPSRNLSVNTPSSANVSSTGILSWFSRKGSDEEI